MGNGAGEGQRICLTNQRVAIRRGGIVGSVAAALMAAGAGAAVEDRRISVEVEWLAYTMAALDAEERKATGDLIFASGGESMTPPNPCAALTEPTGVCPCPPSPPWVPYCI